MPRTIHTKELDEKGDRAQPDQHGAPFAGRKGGCRSGSGTVPLVHAPNATGRPTGKRDQQCDHKDRAVDSAKLSNRLVKITEGFIGFLQTKPSRAAVSCPRSV